MLQQNLTLSPTRSFQKILEETLERSQNYLLDQQKEDGHWIAPLDTDISLTAEYLLLAHYLDKREIEREKKAIQYILDTQTETGGWSIYPGGQTDVNCTVKCYFALKLLGFSIEDPVMVRAREEALKQGGVHQTYLFTKVLLAILGQYSWKYMPAMPVEMMLAPNYFYFNIYETSYWARAITVPLSIIYSLRKSREIPDFNIDELVVPGSKPDNYGGRTGLIPSFFDGIDRLLKLYMKRPSKVLQKKALEKAEDWILEHFNDSEGLGGIYPAMLNSLIALRMLGYSNDDPIFKEQWKHFESLMIEEEETLRLQPCLSPVWDTGHSLNALNACGLSPDHPAKQKAARWLLSKQATTYGDWHIKNRKGKPGGWAIQYKNDFYTDADDTAVVLMALQGVDLGTQQEKLKEAIQRGNDWLVSMQNKDGGWGAFEKENNKELLNHLPFIDYSALLDPSTADVSGRVLEWLGQTSVKIPEKTLKKAIHYLIKEQETDGCWYGRWGINYIYGSWSVLCGLKSAGVQMKSDYVQKCVQWLKSCQNEDGGWGESCYTYEDATTRGQGKSTVSQTSWALIALMNAEERDTSELRKGVEYLITQQRENGDFQETEMTGAGFPGILYLRYHMYRLYFPLKALAMYRDLHFKRGLA